jgi:hypothetical protein
MATFYYLMEKVLLHDMGYDRTMVLPQLGHERRAHAAASAEAAGATKRLFSFANEEAPLAVTQTTTNTVIQDESDETRPNDDTDEHSDSWLDEDDESDTGVNHPMDTDHLPEIPQNRAVGAGRSRSRRPRFARVYSRHHRPAPPRPPPVAPSRSYLAIPWVPEFHQRKDAENNSCKFNTNACVQRNQYFIEIYNLMYKTTFTTLPFAGADHDANHAPGDVDFYSRCFYQQAFYGMTHVYSKYCHCRLKYSRFDFLTYTYFNIFNQRYQSNYMRLFYLTQKMYRGFTQLARLYKYRRANVFNTCDLVMNDFSREALVYPRRWSDDNPRVWSVLQNKTLFFFSQRDLCQAWNSALSNMPYFIQDPLALKNPYNNVPFHHGDLHNIWLFLRQGSMKIPRLIYYFHRCNFCLKLFAERHGDDIREVGFLNFVNNETPRLMMDCIDDMVEDHAEWIKIDPDFPRDRLMEVMRPYVYLFLCVRYNTKNRNKNKQLLRKLLLKFHMVSPTFGRKLVTTSRNIFGKKTEGPPKIHFIDNAPKLTLRQVAE